MRDEIYDIINENLGVFGLVVKNMGQDSQDFENLLNDLIIRFVEKYDKWDKKYSLGTFLKQLGRNVNRDALNKKKSSPSTGYELFENSAVFNQNIDDRLDKYDELTILFYHSLQLPPTQRIIAIDYFILGRGVSASKQTISEIRKRLSTHKPNDRFRYFEYLKTLNKQLTDFIQEYEQ